MRFVIIGAGAVGLSLTEKLASADNEVVLIEKDPVVIEKLPGHMDIQTIHGNGCNPQTLIDAGIKSADYCIAVTDNDEINIAAGFTCKLIAPQAQRIGRLRSFNYRSKHIDDTELDNLFDLVLNPDQVAAEYLSSLLSVPGAVDVIDFAGGKLKIFAIEVTENSQVANKKINSLTELQDEFPILLIAIIRDQTVIVPRGTDRIKPGDIVYTVSRPEHIDEVCKLAGRDTSELKNIMVWGKTGFARQLVHILEKQSINVKYVIRDAFSEDLIDEFNEALIIKGEVTNRHLLEEENISDADAFIALGLSEEENILAALLAKKLGARFSVALVNNPSYKPLVNSIGVDTTVNSYLAASIAIFRFIYAGSILSAYALVHTDASFIEIVVTEEHDFSNKVISECDIPYGIIFAAIIREEELIIPSGQDTIMLGDRLVIFYTRSVMQKLEKILGIKLKLFS